MFAKLSLFGLAIPAVVSARIILFAPGNWVSTLPSYFQWSTVIADDPEYFSLVLKNPAFKVATSLGQYKTSMSGTNALLLSDMPVGDGYFLEASNITDHTIVYYTTTTFINYAANSY